MVFFRYWHRSKTPRQSCLTIFVPLLTAATDPKFASLGPQRPGRLGYAATIRDRRTAPKIRYKLSYKVGQPERKRQEWNSCKEHTGVQIPLSGNEKREGYKKTNSLATPLTPHSNHIAPDGIQRNERHHSASAQLVLRNGMKKRNLLP